MPVEVPSFAAYLAKDGNSRLEVTNTQRRFFVVRVDWAICTRQGAGNTLPRKSGVFREYLGQQKSEGRRLWSGMERRKA